MDKIYETPAATFTETPEGYELKVTLPGVAKENVELNVENRTLSLKAENKYQPPAGFKQVVNEFARADYAMSVDLPEMADTATLGAKMANGVLTVCIKKRPETQPKRITIA